MKKLIITVMLIIGITAPTAHAGTSSVPDFKLKCRNGKYAKVWLAPFKVVNNCGNHSKQWTEVHVDQYPGMDNDPYILSVAAGAKFAPQYKWNIPIEYVKVRLGRGVFCHFRRADGQKVDVEVVYRAGSTWRASCE